METTTKKAWEQPTVEVLDVNETMAATHDGPLTDEAYVPGIRNKGPRFTS